MSKNDQAKTDQADIETLIEFQRKRETRLTKDGKEIGSSVPMEPPLGYNRTPTLAEQIRSMVRSEKLAQEASAAGAETFEEADDFDIGDDYEPNSPYENEFDPPLSELLAAGEKALREKKERAAAQSPQNQTLRPEDGNPNPPESLKGEAPGAPKMPPVTEA